MLLPIVLGVMVLAGVTEAKGQYIHAEYVGPHPNNTGGVPGTAGSTGLGGSGAPGVLKPIGANYMTTSPTLDAVSGLPGKGLGGGNGGQSNVWINLNFTNAIKPQAQTRIYIKAEVFANTNGIVNGLLFQNPKQQLLVQTYNATTNTLGTPFKLSELTTTEANDCYVFTPTEECTSLRFTLLTDLGHTVLGLTGGSSTANAVIKDVYFYDPTCNPPKTTAKDIKGLSLGGSVTSLEKAIDGDLTSHSEFSTGLVGVGATLIQTVSFYDLSNPGDAATVTLSVPNALIAVDLLGSLTVKAYNNNTLVGTTVISSLLQGTDLLTLLQSGAKSTISFVPSAPFNRIDVEMASLASVLASLYVYEIQQTPAKPSFTGLIPPAVKTVSICPNTTATLAAIDPSNSNNELRWYDSNGVLKFTGNPYITDPLNAETFFYVATAKKGCLAESERVLVKVIVPPLPLPPLVASQSICPGSTATLTVNPIIPTLTYKWYDVPTGGMPLLNDGTSFTTPILTANKNYYVESVITGVGCVSTSRTLVEVTIKPTPTLTSPSTANICNGATVSYTATVASSFSGTTFKWDRASVPGIIPTAAGTANSHIITETLTNNTNAPIDVPYVFTLTFNGCTTEQTVLVKVNPTLALSSTPSPDAICSGTLFSYTPTSLTPGVTFKWTRAANANISNAAVTTAVTGDINEVLTNTSLNPVVVLYSYTLTLNGCPVTKGVVVTVNPTPSVVVNNINVCHGLAQAVLPYSNASPNLSSYSIKWDNDAITLGHFVDHTNQILPASSINISIPNNAALGTYNGILTVKNNTDCVSSDIPFSVTLISTPITPPITPQTY